MNVTSSNRPTLTRNPPPQAERATQTREKRIALEAISRQFYPDLTSDRMESVDFEYLYNPLVNNIDILPEKEKGFVETIDELKRQFALNLRSSSPRRSENDIYEYLNSIFQAKNQTELTNKIDSSTIIPKEEITPMLRNKIFESYSKYRLYRKYLHKRLKFIEESTQKKETVMSESVNQAGDVAGAVAQQAKKIEARWNSMSGQEKLVSGAALLFAFSWFWNSEKSADARKALGKALKLGVGFYAANVASKLFLDKKLTDIAYQKAEGLAGTYDIYEKAFDCDQEEAELMSEGIVSLGTLNGMELFKLYLRRKKTYKEHPAIRENQKELMIGETSMDKRKVWKVLSIFDRKYDIEGIYKVLEGVKADMGSDFVSPSFGDIVSAAMMKTVPFKIENGRITTTSISEVQRPVNFERTPIEAETKSWWVLTGQPYNWRMRTFFPDKYGEEKKRSDHLAHITKYETSGDKPLSDFITEANFKRFNPGFTNLYNKKYKNNPNQSFHVLEEKAENVAYATSRITIDYKTHPDINKARSIAIASAYDQALGKLKNKYGIPNNDITESRLKEYAQPVHGIFLTDENGDYTDYVMFMRLVLPPKSKEDEEKSGSIEFKMRKNKKWSEGTAIDMLQRNSMNSGDILRYSEFKAIACNLGPIRDVQPQSADTGTIESLLEKGKQALNSIGILNLRSEDAPTDHRERYDVAKYRGAFETFLAKTGLKSDDNNKINKILEHFSKKYAGKGLSKEGLTTYLATKNYNTDELKNILDENIKGPNIYSLIFKKTKRILDAKPGLLPDQRKAFLATIMTSVGNEFVMACNGDNEAIPNTIKTQIALELKPEAILSSGLISNYLILQNTSVRTNFFNGKLLPIYEKIVNKTIDLLLYAPSSITSQTT